MKTAQEILDEVIEEMQKKYAREKRKIKLEIIGRKRNEIHKNSNAPRTSPLLRSSRLWYLETNFSLQHTY